MNIKNMILVVSTITVFTIMGFVVSDLHGTNYAMPDVTGTCPSLCELNISMEKCQIPECDYLHYYHWFWIPILKKEV